MFDHSSDAIAIVGTLCSFLAIMLTLREQRRAKETEASLAVQARESSRQHDQKLSEIRSELSSHEKMLEQVGSRYIVANERRVEKIEQVYACLTTAFDAMDKALNPLPSFFYAAPQGSDQERWDAAQTRWKEFRSEFMRADFYLPKTLAADIERVLKRFEDDLWKSRPRPGSQPEWHEKAQKYLKLREEVSTQRAAIGDQVRVLLGLDVDCSVQGTRTGLIEETKPEPQSMRGRAPDAGHTGTSPIHLQASRSPTPASVDSLRPQPTVGAPSVPK